MPSAVPQPLTILKVSICVQQPNRFSTQATLCNGTAPRSPLCQTNSYSIVRSHLQYHFLRKASSDFPDVIKCYVMLSQDEVTLLSISAALIFA